MRRPLLRAEILSVGTELTTGTTRDTNAGDIAGDLFDAGVRVGRLVALPDELDVVTAAFAAALERADLVVTTGGLGPTPDDLTREAIAAAVSETPTVDPQLEAWLRAMWARRRATFPVANLKQAWRIPSASAIPNDHGTAPGWWVERPDGRLIVALPGPPREMWPMWRGWVREHLRERGLGATLVVRTLRLTGIGESQLADLLGPLLRSTEPLIATYARADAVDVRITAADAPASDGSRARTADEIADEAEAAVTALVGPYVWGRDDATWADVLDRALAAGERRLAIVEIGTRGAVGELLAACERVGRVLALDTSDPEARAVEGGRPGSEALDRLAERAMEAAAADVAVAVTVRDAGQDTAVTLVIVDRTGRRHRERQRVFRRGELARRRVGVAAASTLLRFLRAGDGASVG